MSNLYYEYGRIHPMISLLSDIEPEQRCLFSIIIPVFETTDILLYNIGGIRDQAEQQWEAIYGFDGDLPSHYAEFDESDLEDPRIRILRNGKPDTIGELFNYCLDAARGENIILLHAEDALLERDTLANLAKEIEAHPERDYCYFINRGNDYFDDYAGPRLQHPHDQIPHRISELDEFFYPTETLYYLYKRSTIIEHNLRFQETNSPHLHEQFSQAYAQHVKVFTSAQTEFDSTFEPFTFPPAMKDED